MGYHHFTRTLLLLPLPSFFQFPLPVPRPPPTFLLPSSLSVLSLLPRTSPNTASSTDGTSLVPSNHTINSRSQDLDLSGPELKIDTEIDRDTGTRSLDGKGLRSKGKQFTLFNIMN